MFLETKVGEHFCKLTDNLRDEDIWNIMRDENISEEKVVELLGDRLQTAMTLQQSISTHHYAALAVTKLLEGQMLARREKALMITVDYVTKILLLERFSGRAALDAGPAMVRDLASSYVDFIIVTENPLTDNYLREQWKKILDLALIKMDLFPRKRLLIEDIPFTYEHIKLREWLVRAIV